MQGFNSVRFQPRDMYSVVGCSDCAALKIVDGRPDTTVCNRCGKHLRFEKLKKFLRTEDLDHAREIRASILANKSGHGDAFARVGSFAELDAETEEPVVSDEEYLEGSGIDVDEVAAAGERAMASGKKLSRRDAVLAALEELDRPTEDEVAAFAAEHGAPREFVEDALEKLRRRGEVSESGGRYRLL